MTANSVGAPEQPRPYPDGPGDVPADTFSVRLLLARHHAGRLSIEQAAKRCGLNAGNWVRWEDGASPRDKVEVAQAVAAGLDINFNWLLLGGPLLPALGRLTKRRRDVTNRYQFSPSCTGGGRSIGLARSSESGRPPRRPQVTVRSQPVRSAT